MAKNDVVIEPLASETIKVPIIGTTPLIVNKFSERKKKEMLESFQGKKVVKKPKDPKQEYEESYYRMKKGYGFPSIGFKKATVGGARFYKNVAMTDLRQMLFFHGEISPHETEMLVQIVGTPRMREDVVRNSKGGTDLRYRAEFPEWRAVLCITWIQAKLDRSSVLSLIDAGGLGCGAGDWTPARGGHFGTYRIDTKKKVEVIG